MLLPVTMRATYTLLDALWIPWQIVIDYQGAKLQIDALSTRFSGN